MMQMDDDVSSDVSSPLPYPDSPPRYSDGRDEAGPRTPPTTPHLRNLPVRPPTQTGQQDHVSSDCSSPLPYPDSSPRSDNYDDVHTPQITPHLHNIHGRISGASCATPQSGPATPANPASPAVPESPPVSSSSQESPASPACQQFFSRHPAPAQPLYRPPRYSPVVWGQEPAGTDDLGRPDPSCSPPCPSAEWKRF